MNDQPSIRRLGDGYEAHVDEQAGVLVYSLPVDSGMVTASFSFEVQQADLAVMLSNPYRRAVLQVTAHSVLQRDANKVTQREFDDLVAVTLHSTPLELEQFLRRFDIEHNLVTRIFVDQVLARPI